MNTAVKEIIEPIDTWSQTYRKPGIYIKNSDGHSIEASVMVARHWSNESPFGEVIFDFFIERSTAGTNIRMSADQMRELAELLNKQALYLDELTGKGVQS